MSSPWTFAVARGKRPSLDALDPRVRIGYAVVFSVSVVLTPTSFPLRVFVHGFIFLLLSAMARVPFGVYLRRVGAVSPFLVFVFLSALIAYPTGGVRPPFPDLVLRIAVKPLLVVGTLTALLYGMDAHEVVRGLAGLGLPGAITVPLLFLLRYLPTFRQRIGKLRMGMEARSFGWRGLWGRRRLLGALGSLVGTVFLQSLDHGERVYWAMLARDLPESFRVASAGGLSLGMSASCPLGLGRCF